MSSDYNSVYIGTLQRALELLGGERELARYLRVPASELREWLAGHETPPRAYFLAAVDLIQKSKP